MKKGKLPLIVESEIFLVCADHKSHKAKGRVLGARHGDFILVENAVYRPNERFSVPLEGTLNCSYPHEGDVYHFQSRIQTDLGNGLAFLEYPLQFQVEKIRKHHRILVDIETRFYLQGAEEPMDATMTDISEGGCCLVVSALFPAVRHTVCEIELTLPDDQQIVGLKAKIQKIGFSTLRKTTELGLQFLGPAEPMAKIASFCHFCMFFKV
ncbi:MAG: PilZ domain-containing protein [Syntrophobacteraceae bacterium]|nr:PilZ domain-containing protein [Syntrophobacteraceae bacterium]